MTRMADGLYVLGDTLESLMDNFIEVLTRAKLCEFTFKASKSIIVPQTTALFGWRKSADGWSPTARTVSPLIKAEPQPTIKQMRSWVGSLKQLTECIQDYAIMLGLLETMIGN